MRVPRAVPNGSEPSDSGSLELVWGDADADAGTCGAPAPAGRRRSGGSSRAGAVLAAVAVLVLVALGAAALSGTRYLDDADLRAALSSSTRDLDTALASLTAATTTADLAAAARQSRAAAARVERAADRLGPVSAARDVVVRDQLRAEQALLAAAGGLSAVTDDPVATWASVADRLRAALQAEATARSELRRHHPGAAQSLPATDPLLGHVTQVVGPALVAHTTDRAAGLLARLDAVRDTAGLRALADEAGADADGLAAAARALPAGQPRTVLTSYDAALHALASLSSVDAERPEAWPPARAGLAAGLGQVPGAGAAAEQALTSVDRVVGAAVARLQDWRARTELTLAARTADQQAVETYADVVRRQLAAAAQVQAQLAAAAQSTPAVDTGTEQVVERARSVRGALVRAPVPGGLDVAHAELVAALEAWSPAADTGAYAAAAARWEAAVEAERALVAGRVLPARPAG